MEQKSKLLLVDDDYVNLGILEELFEDNYELLSVNSGEKAIQVLDSYCPDLILLDIMMPNMNGYEVCKMIRENKKHKFIKIILVSGKSSIEERMEGYRSGADDYVTKPFELDELEAKVAVFIKLKYTQELDFMKSSVIRLFSHESRTPLNGIIGPAQLLKQSFKLDSDADSLVDMIIESGNRLFDFVKKATLYCEVKSKPEIDCWEDRPVTYLNKIVSAMESKFVQKKLTVEIDFPDDLRLTVDWQKVEKVFEFIIDNAIKYSKKEGKIKIFKEQKDNFDIIAFQDFGLGIARDNQSYVFEEFRVKDIMLHREGLNLSMGISRTVMELHDGEITFETEPGKGTIFRLLFPKKVFR